MISVSSQDVKAVGKTVEKGLKAAKAISGSIGRTSITRMAKDSILQSPVITSSSIGTDETIAIARGIEKFMAAMTVSVFSMRTVDLSKNDDVAQYIKRFHNNSDIPANIKAATNFVFESAAYSSDPNLQATLADVLSCWNVVTEQIDMTSLNDVYRPYDNTKEIIADKIERLKSATESIMDTVKNPNTEKILNKIGSLSDGNFQDRPIRSRETTKDTKLNEIRKTDKQITSNTFNAIVRNDKVTSLEPTMATIQFIVHGGEGDNKQFTQNVVLGFKAMVRMVRSDIMVANMTEAVKNSNMIFRFIKWTKGEYKFVKDFIFNLTEIKDSAISDSSDKNFLKALKRRKAINNVSRFFDNSIPPSTTIIMSSYEVARVAEATGVNLNEAHNALNLLNKYYLIGFGIYDTETKILSTLFDGETEFADTTIDGLRSSTDRNSNLISMSDAMKAFGRI